MPSYLIVGASRGIGGATAAHLAELGANILSVSRSEAMAGLWIPADVSTDEGIRQVLEAAGDGPLDGLLFLGGIWEDGAFTDAYDFLKSPASETRRVLAVNLTAPILLAQGLAANLAQSTNPRVILMGSTSGLPNAASPEVANTAAKFGLQGVAEALNLSLRPQGIATTVINPDNVATAEVIDDIAEGRFDAQIPISMDDVIRTVDYILGLSADSVPSSITLGQKRPQ